MAEAQRYCNLQPPERIGTQMQININNGYQLPHHPVQVILVPAINKTNMYHQYVGML
jgi:hypothetical protein